MEVTSPAAMPTRFGSDAGDGGDESYIDNAISSLEAQLTDV